MTRGSRKKYKIPFDEHLVKYCSYTAEEVEVNLNALFFLPVPPDAFLTGADRLALGYFAGLKKRNVRIPADIAFVGFSNLNVAELLSPPMSVVVQPAFEMGHTAAGLLLDLIEKKPKQPVFRTVCLPTELFVRESSRP